MVIKSYRSKEGCCFGNDPNPAWCQMCPRDPGPLPGEWNLAAVRGHPVFYQGRFPYSKNPLGTMWAPYSRGIGFHVFESSIILCGQENVPESVVQSQLCFGDSSLE